MKKIAFILFTLTAILTARGEDMQYSQAMEEALKSMETANDKGSVIALRNRFEMIHGAYPDNWLPAYYIALCDLEAVYKDLQAEDVQARLEDTKKYLDILTETDSADQSEVNTRYGY
ncbi:MAG: hypothetical protein LUE10_00740, partial [Alistipes sp.]|nr:hypothetical protein [Alistipes sp.]